MIEPLISDRAVEFDGKVIGSVRYSQEDAYSYGAGWIAYAPSVKQGERWLHPHKYCTSREAAHAWLVERYAKSQEGE